MKINSREKTTKIILSINFLQKSETEIKKFPQYFPPTIQNRFLFYHIFICCFWYGDNWVCGVWYMKLRVVYIINICILFVYLYVVLFGSSLFYVAFIFLWAIIATSGAIEWYFPISLLFFVFFCHPQIALLWCLVFMGFVSQNTPNWWRKNNSEEGGKCIFMIFLSAGDTCPFCVIYIFNDYIFLFCGAKTIKLQSNVSMDLIIIKWTIKIQ